MTQPAIVYDLTRLVLGPTLPVPRGIDRVDLGYARYFFETWPAECYGVLPLPLGLLGGVVVIRREAARKLLHHIAATWGETARAGEDRAYAFVLARLSEQMTDFRQPRPPRHFRPGRVVTGLFRTAFRMGAVTGLGLRGAIPANAIYVNTGQLGLGFHWLTAWLSHRPDIRRVHMLHDAIPLEHPDLVTPAARALHGRMIVNTARNADALIVTTETVRRSVLRELQRCGRDDIPTVAAPLPVAPLFLEEPFHEPRLSQARYFVTLGSIEPRKNHALLIEVWKRWTEPDPPWLVIVGTPWREAEKVMEAIAADPQLRRRVIQVSGLTSPALRILLRHACALLQPSFIEGFGLPIIEALAVGTPVIASDQPSHREAGGRFAAYLDPRDADAWQVAIRKHCQSEARIELASHRPWDWGQYGAVIAPFLEKVGCQDRLA